MGLQSNIQSEPVASLPLREGIIVTADATVRSVMDRMRQRQLGCAIVVDPDGRPLGTFSGRSVIELLLQQPDQLEQLTVGRALDEAWYQVRNTEPIVTVLNLVQQQGARFVCVIDEQGRAVGLTGQKGLSEYIADHYPQQVMIQRVGGRPGQLAREGA
jgi:CBS domain-containing protein